jgi:hypothetical protein
MWRNPREVARAGEFRTKCEESRAGEHSSLRKKMGGSSQSESRLPQGKERATAHSHLSPASNTAKLSKSRESKGSFKM